MLIPDAQVQISYEDIDGADAGRDESGYMHRILLRSKVASWGFSYAHLTEWRHLFLYSSGSGRRFPVGNYHLLSQPVRYFLAQCQNRYLEQLQLPDHPMLRRSYGDIQNSIARWHSAYLRSGGA